MRFNLMTLSRVAMPVSLAEGLKILERDHYCCRYCGLDGKGSFEHALVMIVDFVLPRAHKGKKDAANLVAFCRPCNMIKGTGMYKNFDEAQKYVLAHREKLHRAWEAKFQSPSHPVHQPHVELCAGICASIPDTSLMNATGRGAALSRSAVQLNPEAQFPPERRLHQ